MDPTPSGTEAFPWAGWKMAPSTPLKSSSYGLLTSPPRSSCRTVSLIKTRLSAERSIGPVTELFANFINARSAGDENGIEAMCWMRIVLLRCLLAISIAMTDVAYKAS